MTMAISMPLKPADFPLSTISDMIASATKEVLDFTFETVEPSNLNEIEGSLVDNMVAIPCWCGNNHP